ncbi:MULTISPECIES: rodlet layer protein [Kitasatospora]|uniref:Rodlet layer protein n=1 Tax=Kitasatospora cystarginea TaxID=58350 RepID=A0ABN3DHM1_9ACTN
MLKKTFATIGLAAAAVAAASTPAVAIGDSDGHSASMQGNGGTNATGTVGNHSPNFHFMDNPNVCLPEIDNVAVAVLGVAVPVKVDALNTNPKQTCVVGQGTQGSGDGGVGHLIG